jgi:hypothetical protein
LLILHNLANIEDETRLTLNLHQSSEHTSRPPPEAALSFDRAAACGKRLDIAAGTAVRFEPGQTRDVRLVPLGGKREIFGARGDVMGLCSAGNSAERQPQSRARVS